MRTNSWNNKTTNITQNTMSLNQQIKSSQSSWLRFLQSNLQVLLMDLMIGRRSKQMRKLKMSLSAWIKITIKSCKTSLKRWNRWRTANNWSQNKQCFRLFKKSWMNYKPNTNMVIRQATTKLKWMKLKKL